jgi:hypothetical protein
VIGVVWLGTGPYSQFFQDFHSSIFLHFVPGAPKQIIAFTDEPSISDTRQDTVAVFTNHEPWPFSSMNRFRYLNDASHVLSAFDYVFFFQANAVVMKSVEFASIEPGPTGLTGVVSNPFIFERNRNDWSYCRDPRSQAYIPFDEGTHYFRGGFFGGKSDAFLMLSKTCAQWIDEDARKGVIPQWHDESYLNKYFLTNQPRVLDPGFCFAEEWKPGLSYVEEAIAMRTKPDNFRQLKGLLNPPQPKKRLVDHLRLRTRLRSFLQA